MGPGRHGRRFSSHYAPGTYDWVPSSRDDIRGDPFWDALAARGHRFAVLDVPKAPIGKHAENLVVADWMRHGAHGIIGEPASVLDLAPTVARLVGAPFDGEGSAIPGLVRCASDQTAVGSTLNEDQSSA